MSDDTDREAPEHDAEHPEKPLERPTTDTKLITEMVASDAAAAIREALGPGHGDAAVDASGDGGVPTVALHHRLGSVEERLERLADLEDRFSRIEEAIDELRNKLDGDEGK